LAVKEIEGDGLEVPLVGRLEYQYASRSQDSSHFGDGRAGVVEMVDYAHTDDGVEGGVWKRKVEGVSLHDRITWIVTECFPGRVELDSRQIEEHHFSVSGVLVGEASKACADLHEPIPGSGQESPERDPIASILVAPSGPEAVPIAKVDVRWIG
jgi:hypothetical protein